MSCNYALSGAVPNGGSMMLGITSDNPLVTTQPTMTLAAGVGSGTFVLRVGTVPSDQTANVTVTDGIVSKIVTVTLLGPPTLTSLACSPATLNPGAQLSCTVTLSRTVGNEAVSVSLTGTPDVSVPAAVNVPSGSGSANFTATVSSAPKASSAVLTATLNGSTRSFTLNAAPIGISSLVCNPTILAAGATAGCTVTLTNAAGAGGVTLLLASTSPDLTAPATVTVPSGSSTASFSAIAGSPTSDEPANLTASLGSASQATTFTLQASPAISSLTCALTTLPPGGTTTCTVVLSKAGGNSTITLTSPASSTGLVLPASVAVPAGSTSATFSVTAPNAAGSSFQIIASLGSSSQSITITIGQGTISSLACTPDPALAGALDCTLALAQVTASPTVVNLQANSSRVQLPSQVQVAAGAQSVQFIANVSASDQDAQVQIAATVQGAVLTTALSVIGIRPTALACSSLTIQAGGTITCAVRLNSPNIPQIARLGIVSSNPNLQVPALITSRPRQTELSFEVVATPVAGQQPSAITVQLGNTSASALVIVNPSATPVLTLPAQQLTAFGNAVAFTFSAVDPGGLPLVLSAANLPAGATFDSDSGSFSWTPGQSQQGSFDVTFTATNSDNVSSSGDVIIQVDSGKPVISDLRNAASQVSGTACSPGSVASLTGRWLASGNLPVSDPTGASMQLGGSQVSINGTSVPVVYASTTRLDFLCPALDPGTTLTIAVQTANGNTDPVQATMQALTPALYSFDGSGQGQGLVTLAGTSLLATTRAYNVLGQPAEPGDSITIMATGIGTSGVPPVVSIGGVSVTADSIQTILAAAGVYQINVTIPAGVAPGDAVPVFVQMTAPDGSVVQSNTVAIAIEPGR
ncbi:MAG TPA: putative Ig domain-containing protein [Verrucomicrobiae bacterium]|nr:putative Ig domain-containing protein [Verrucomicrobiae bacterium]